MNYNQQFWDLVASIEADVTPESFDRLVRILQRNPRAVEDAVDGLELNVGLTPARVEYVQRVGDEIVEAVAWFLRQLDAEDEFFSPLYDENDELSEEEVG